MLTARNTAAFLLPADHGAPEWVELLPAGDVEGRDGRRFINDRPDAVIDAFVKGGLPLPFDIEHASESEGGEAPAVGWIAELQNRCGAIWGRVEWTARGTELVGTRAYRFVSPAFLHTTKDGRVVALTSAALTHRPNLQLQALNCMELGMPLIERLVAELGLPSDTTEDALVAHIKTSRTELVAARHAAQNPSLSRFVPRADHDAVVEKLNTAVTALNAAEAAKHERAVDDAIAAGKITPATRAYHLAACKADPGAFEKFIAAVEPSPLAQAGKAPPAEPGGELALTPEEKAICSAGGHDEAEFAKELANHRAAIAKAAA